MGRYSDYGWAPYVSAAERKAKAAKLIEKERKNGKNYNPIVIQGRTICKTFWGKAWCENLESYSDFENRLPRGRTYARNGSIIDFQVQKGKIEAKVMGSELYRVTITILEMAQVKWQKLAQACAGKIDSLIELLQGKFSKGVMEILTEKEKGLFPKPKEIKMSCSCPDYAGMCKHIAAVLYGMGASLDSNPEWLFSLRQVDHLDLIASVDTNSTLLQQQGPHDLINEDLSALFGIEIDSGMSSTSEVAVAIPPAKKTVKPKTTKASPKQTIAKAASKKPAKAKSVVKPASTKAKLKHKPV